VAIPFGDKDFMYLAAALVGASFNPWMVFYQQSATADKKLLRTTPRRDGTPPAAPFSPSC
jgi:Mn2+/Fe2+ NRAMP family transporter